KGAGRGRGRDPSTPEPGGRALTGVLSRQAEAPGTPSRRCARPGAGAGVTRLRSPALRVGAPLAAALLVLALWQLYASASGIRESTLPRPTQVLLALYADRRLLAAAAWVTIGEILLGYAAAILLGVGLAVVVHTSPVVERALYPWLVAS